jgi:integrase
VLTAEELLAAWARERTPAPNTLRKYRIAFAHVARILGFADVRRITEEDVIRFKEARLEEGRTVQTVGDDVLACSAVCTWGVKNRRLPVNPFRGLAPRPKERGEPTRFPYTDEEAAAILTATRGEKGWRRWLPWLLAFTGARISEVAELRRGDVREDSGVPILDIVPIAGREGKNRTFQRKLPIHPAVQAEGFLDYVAKLPSDAKAPLFPDLALAGDKTRSTTAKNNHGRWVRKVAGVTREGTAPAHSWRHRMEDELRKVRALPEVMDAITGRHNPRNAGSGYGRGFRNMPDETLKELQKIPSPLSPAPGPSRDRSGAYLSANAALLAWFESELERASQAVEAAEAVDDQAARAEQLRHLEDEAAGRIERRDASDPKIGNALARLVAKTMENPPEQGSPAFRALRGAVVQAEGLIAEATMRWASGDDLHQPECPVIEQAEEAA